MGKRIFWFVALALSLSAGAPVGAHIPATSFLLDRMAKQRAKLGYRRLKVTMQCKETPAEQAAVEQVLYLKVPGLVRRERGGAVVDICRNGKCYRKSGSSRPSPLPAWAYLPYLYFVEFDVEGSRYMGLLESLKVDTRVNTITRFYSQLAVVLGAKNWERDRPQFWMDKDKFLPFRLMVRDDKALLDFLWIQWGSKTGGDWFPETLEIRRDGQVMEQCQVTEVKTGVSMPDELFKI